MMPRDRGTIPRGGAPVDFWIGFIVGATGMAGFALVVYALS